jgi:enoyl-CoA hydratase/carnithine racemase
VANDEVLLDRDGPVLTLTFNRPTARNALTWAMYEALYRACEEVDTDDALRVMVLRGAGGQAFAAGTDIAQFTTFTTAEDGVRYERDLDRWVGRLGRVAKPVIAAIAGVATGGGFELAAACDLRLATPDARLGLPIARTLGNCVSMDAYARFLDLFGPSRLTELIFTARLLPAAEAHAVGFVHEVVPLEELDARARALALELAERAPLTLRITKEAIRRLQAARRLPDGEDLIALAYGSADFHEGVLAFLAKRKPRWTGT